MGTNDGTTNPHGHITDVAEIEIAEREVLRKIHRHNRLTEARIALEALESDEDFAIVDPSRGAAGIWEDPARFDDYRLGELYGGLCALRWVLGYDWDVLDS